MKTVHKYPLDPLWPLPSAVAVKMPDGAEVLHVAEQHGALWLWALVDDDAPLVTRRFQTVGTGHEVPAGRARFVGTALIALMALEEFVVHVFEVAGSYPTAQANGGAP